MTLLAALMLTAATHASAPMYIGVKVVRSASVSSQLRPAGLQVQSRGAQPAQVQVAPASADGNLVVTLLY
jgi:hypothetical protein